MSVVALDIGSSRIKAVLADWDGRIVDIRSAKTPVVAAVAGEHAFPADAVLAAAEAHIAGLADSHQLDAIDTVVFSCLGTAMVPVDRSERPLGPALSPADTRPPMGAALEADLGLPMDRLRHLTGSDPRIASFLGHFVWWRQAHPEVIDRLHRFRSLRGFIVQRLCGADAEDQTWASRTMLMDLATNAWSEAILSAAKLPTEVLPEILPSTTA
ncbi:MAG: FGGY family carbohydrate kinase, partial [Chloroflexota bacterium]